MIGNRKLGRGLDVLIPQRTGGNNRGREVHSLPVEEIAPNRFQPRQAFGRDDLEDLAASISREGVLQPILVRPSGSGYELISGERRLRAAKMAKLATIPAIILDVDDRKSQEIALVENLQREDLNPVEQAQGIQSLITRYNLTQDTIADVLGMRRSTVANSLRLLELPEKILSGLARGLISSGHAKVLLSITNPEAQLSAFQQAHSKGLSVRALEELIAGGGATPTAGGNGKGSKGKGVQRAAAVVAMEDELTRLLGTKVHVKASGTKGVIKVHFYSSEDFERLLDLFRAAQPA